MEVVLGVSMTPTAVRMVLVEGSAADGVTVDHSTTVPGPANPSRSSAEQVLAAILGTRESAAEEAHRIAGVGVAWSDHTAAAHLRDALRARDIDDVVLVSELHAAAALAQAVGRRMGCPRTALVFVEDATATLAVVRTSDGAVVAVSDRSLYDDDATAGMGEMIAHLESMPEPPRAVFIIGAGVDISALRAEIASRTTLPVHIPEEPELALARGAALAAAQAPRFEAATVGLHAGEEDLTEAGPTQLAPVADASAAEDAEKPFVLVGSALASIFVVGMLALAISLAVTIRPAADQRPDPGPPATAPANSQTASTPAPQTIPAPVPVVQQAPRNVVVAPAAPAAPAARPAPVAVPVPAAAPVPAPAAPPPAPVPVAPAPAPAAPAPVVVPFPVFLPSLPAPNLPVLLPPVPAPVAPRSVPAAPPPSPPSTTSQIPVTQTVVPSTATTPATTTTTAAEQTTTTSVVTPTTTSATVAPSTTTAPATTTTTAAEPSTTASAVTPTPTSITPLVPAA